MFMAKSEWKEKKRNVPKGRLRVVEKTRSACLFEEQ